MGKSAKKPKKKCCVAKVRCERCPIRLLKEGRLPEGYTVKRRKLVKLETPSIAPRKSKKKLAA